MAVTEDQLEIAVNRLVNRFDSLRIILFGSQARGTADKRSDVDILVVTNFSGKRRPLAVEMDLALKGVGFARDIIVLTPEEFDMDKEIPGTVARPAAREGKVLHERN